MILSATGHRPEKLGGYSDAVYEKLLVLATYSLESHAPSEVISGMALGWDTAIAEAAFLLRIPYRAYLPFAAQASRWGREAQTLHANLCAGAASVVICSDGGYEAWKMSYRNDCMEKDSDEILALYNGEPSGGTANAVRHATKIGKPLHNVWKEWEAMNGSGKEDREKQGQQFVARAGSETHTRPVTPSRRTARAGDGSKTRR